MTLNVTRNTFYFQIFLNASLCLPPRVLLDLIGSMKHKPRDTQYIQYINTNQQEQPQQRTEGEKPGLVEKLLPHSSHNHSGT